MNGWLRVASAAEYMDVSVKTIRRLIKDGFLPVCRLHTGTILIKQSVIDERLTQLQTSQNDLERKVEEILGGLGL